MLRPVYDESLVPEYNKESTFLSESGIGILTLIVAASDYPTDRGRSRLISDPQSRTQSYEAELVTESETNM